MPFDAANSIEASCVSTLGALLDDVVQDRRADTWIGASVPSRRCARARRERAVVLPQEDDGAVRVHELEQRHQDLVEQLIEFALETDVARELPREAQALVVDAELLRIVRELIVREEALVAAAICVPIARADR